MPAYVDEPPERGAILRLISKYSPRQGWDAFLLMLAASGAAGFSVVEASWVDTPGLLAIILWASVTGLLLAKAPLPWLLLHPIGLGLGFGAVLWRASSLAEGEALADRLGDSWDRLVLWFEAATSGGISTDLLPFSIALLFLAWLLGYLGAWFLFRNTNAWIGLVLGGMALLTNLSYLPKGYESRFFLFMFPAMLLIARISYVQRKDHWRSSNFRLLSGSRWHSIQAAAAIGVVVLLFASLLPLKVYVWQTAVDAWNLGRSPVARFEDHFSRLFSGIVARKDVAGRFFGDTLPFQGKISLVGDIVMQVRSEYPSYWLSRTYSEYTSQGWIAGDTSQVRVGPESLPPPPQESSKRVRVNQSVVVGFDTNNLWVGGNLDWINQEAIAMTLAPPEYRLDIRGSGEDAQLSDDVLAVAVELRRMLDPLTTVFVEAEIARMLPHDLTLVGVSPGIEDTKRTRIDSVIIARKEPTIPDVVGFRLVDRLKSGEAYSMRTFVSQASIKELREAPSDYSGFIKGHYLQLPDSLPQRVRDRAAEITAGAETPIDKALALQDYLRGDTFEYLQDIDKPPRGSDGVDHFLFETRKGYSDYFASAMTVMLRAVGVPARLAAGYAPGQEQEGTNFRAVRDSDSHGWTQAYVPGHGWIDFEPTSIWPLQPRVEPAETEETEVDQAAGSLPEIGDSSGLVDDPCFGIVPEDDLFALENCIGSPASSAAEVDSQVLPPARDLAMWAAAVAAALAGLSWLVWSWGFSSSNSTEIVYAKMGRLGTLAGVSRRTHQTPIEYAKALGSATPGIAAAAQVVATMFAAGRYGRKELSEEDRSELKAMWRGVRGGLLARAFRRLVPLGGPSQP